MKNSNGKIIPKTRKNEKQIASFSDFLDEEDIKFAARREHEQNENFVRYAMHSIETMGFIRAI